MTSRSFRDEDITRLWDDILSDNIYRPKLEEVRNNYPEKKSVFIQYADIDITEPDFASFVLDHPDKCIGIGEKLIMKKMGPEWNPEDRINIRFEKLPRDTHVQMYDIRSAHIGKLVSIEGNVIGCRQSVPRIKNALYRCAKCDTEIWVPQKGTCVEKPMMCTSEGCNKTAPKFILDENKSTYEDIQMMKIADSDANMIVYLHDDMVGRYQNEKLRFNGIIRAMPKLYMDVISIETEQSDYFKVENPKPCPFCGCTDDISIGYVDYEGFPTYNFYEMECVVAYCNMCGCRVQTPDAVDIYNEIDAKERISEVWNKRAVQ